MVELTFNNGLRIKTLQRVYHTLIWRYITKVI